jgi:hypothetical protein
MHILRQGRWLMTGSERTIQIPSSNETCPKRHTFFGHTKKPREFGIDWANAYCLHLRSLSPWIIELFSLLCLLASQISRPFPNQTEREHVTSTLEWLTIVISRISWVQWMHASFGSLPLLLEREGNDLLSLNLSIKREQSWGNRKKKDTNFSSTSWSFYCLKKRTI